MLYEPFNTRLTLDPKGRLTLPKPLRHALAGHGINSLVAVGNDGNRGGLSENFSNAAITTEVRPGDTKR